MCECECTSCMEMAGMRWSPFSCCIEWCSVTQCGSIIRSACTCVNSTTCHVRNFKGVHVWEVHVGTCLSIHAQLSALYVLTDEYVCTYVQAYKMCMSQFYVCSDRYCTESVHNMHIYQLHLLKLSSHLHPSVRHPYLMQWHVNWCDHLH